MTPHRIKGFLLLFNPNFLSALPALLTLELGQSDTRLTMAVVSFEIFYLECLILNLPYQLVTAELIASRDYAEQ